MPRVLFLQYTDPAGYPPLDHAATLLAQAGCSVQFCGIRAPSTGAMELSAHERIAEASLGGPPGGWLGPAKYVAFALRAVFLARRFRPDWCYASDPLAAPAALLIRRATGARIVYHEHDAPTGRPSRAMTRVLRARAELADVADVIVIPSEARRQLLPPRARAKAVVVWNCPLRSEVPPATAASADTLQLVYAGSLSADRLPVTVVDALALLPPAVELSIYGYATVGHPAHAAVLRERARRHGIANRVHERGIVPLHADLIRALRECAVGLSLVRGAADDPNLRSLVHASNKPFDYMAAGIPFLVNDDPEWRATFVEPGYALACRPDDAQSVADSVHLLLAADTRRAMGARAQQRIRDEWNYDTQFAPVLERMSR